MDKLLLRLCFFSFFYLLCSGANAQNRPSRLIDSLKTSAPGKIRVNQLIRLARFYFDTEWNYSNKRKVDSALPYLKEAYRISDSLHNVYLMHASLIEWGKYSYRTDNEATAADKFMAAIEIAELQGERRLQAIAWYHFADRTPVINDKIDVKIDRYRRSLNLFAELHDQEQQFDIRQRIAEELISSGQTDSALLVLERVLLEQQRVKNRTIYKTLHLRGVCHALKGNFNLAVEDNLNALKEFRHVNDPFVESKVCSDLGKWYAELDRPSLSVHYNYLALERVRSIKQPDVHQQFYFYTLLRRMAQTLIKMNRVQEALQLLTSDHAPFSDQTAFAMQLINGAKGDCFKQLGNYNVAEVHYLKALELAIANKRPQNIRSEYLQLADLYTRWNKYDKAKAQLNSYLSYSSARSDLTSLKDIELMLFKIDSASGDLSAAITHYQSYKRLNDTIFSVRKARQIEELQIQYQTTQHEHSIQLLKNKEKLQNAELDKANFYKTAILIGAIVLLILVIFLYRGYRFNQSKNKVLQLQQDAINKKNNSLQLLVNEKENLLTEKNTLLEEKEWLLKEMHHRVKNNLQIVMSLLYSQTVHLDDPEAIRAFINAQQRIHSIALMHQKLYQSNNLQQVNMKDYISELIRHLSEGLNAASEKIQFVLQLEDVFVNISQAVPIGLIVNEAVNNSLKYAFRGNDGQINISFAERDGQCHLCIADNGCGFPRSFDPHKTKTLGLTLIEGLSMQLEADYKLCSEGGVKIAVSFFKELTSPVHGNLHSSAQ